MTTYLDLYRAITVSKFNRLSQIHAELIKNAYEPILMKLVYMPLFFYLQIYNFKVAQNYFEIINLLGFLNALLAKSKYRVFIFLKKSKGEDVRSRTGLMAVYFQTIDVSFRL